ncbi:pentatricopeptide repeat-containing protein At5g66520-like [Aristolochia californica]|uniref:pentatricopeptide repeat-containing protein At5g66520-like n=1 Tax=Aristolochia californica TaxID=171875 RepID=UPI0035D92F67
MLLSGISPDHLTFSFLLKACVRLVDLLTGQGVHGHVLKLGFHNDVYVQNVVISMYAECKVLDSARRVFDEMIEKDVVSWNTLIIGCLRCGVLDLALALFRMMNGKNLITWNSIITGFVQGGRPKEALALFQEMQITSGDGVLPDGITLASVLSACATLGALDQGKWVHRYLKRRGLEFDVVIGTALVDMYGKCGCVDQAVEIFKEMPKKDVLAWTSMIKVLADHGLAREAIELFKEMEGHGTKPNPVTFVPVLCACAHAGLVQQGWRFFQLMTNVYSIAPQAEHYACMVDLLSRTGLFSAAEEVIRGMEVEPDVYVWGALLGGCRMHGNVELGEQGSSEVVMSEIESVLVAVSFELKSLGFLTDSEDKLLEKG